MKLIKPFLYEKTQEEAKDVKTQTTNPSLQPLPPFQVIAEEFSLK